ncbi:phosphatase PAP2 family protein [Nanoarchaeota archaeon]
MKPKDEVMFDITAFGGTPVFITAIILLFFSGKVMHSLQFLIGYIACFVITIPIRLVYFRQRPDKSKVTGWFTRIFQSSFPSLHSLRVTTLALLTAFFFNTLALYIILPIVAILVMITRVGLKRHFISDVIAGAIFGILISGVLVYFSIPI